MPTPQLNLVDVATYNRANLALLQNSYCFIANSNKEFKDFNKDIPYNLGDTVEFDIPPRVTSANGLVASFQAMEQRVQTLTCNKARNASYDFTAQQRIFNVQDYMSVFGRSAVADLGSHIESDTALLAKTNTYRFYGNPSVPINTYSQLASALAFMRNTGAISEQYRGYINDLSVPGIVNSGLNQFVPKKNEREMMSWELGSFSDCEWYKSNLLPTHTAGSEGQNGNTLTVTAVTKNADDAVTSITATSSVVAVDANSFKQYDKCVFSDIATQPNLRFLTNVGQHESQSQVQFRVTANAAKDGAGSVTINIFPPLKASAGRNKNINTEIVANMEFTVLNSHRCGLITAGKPLYLAMPRLPDERPFDTSVETDPKSGASLRIYYGSLFGQNQRGIVHDCLWGNTLVDDYAMMLALPL